MTVYQSAYIYSGSSWIPIAAAAATQGQWIISTIATTTYTPALTDVGKELLFSSATAVTVTAPSDTTVAFVVGQTIPLVQTGAGKVTVAADTGVTILSRSGYQSTSAQYGVIYMTKTASNTWLLSGDLGA